MSNIIYYTVELMGGLGNQMFQIANGFAKSKKYNAKLVLPKNSTTLLQGNNTTFYYDNIFKKLNFDEKNNSFLIYLEQDFSFNEVNLPLDKSIIFKGYYQSSKNFLGYENETIDLFSPSTDEVNSLISKYKEIKYDNTVSVHIRKGDYIKFPDIHPTVSKSYIDTALKKIGHYSHMFVFSDDKNWVKENMNYENMIIVDDVDYNELWLMSLCKNNIISNSSFSWWGAFLNKNKNKLVVCPSIWFGNMGPKNYNDIYENNWIKIKTELKNGELTCY